MISSVDSLPRKALLILLALCVALLAMPSSPALAEKAATTVRVGWFPHPSGAEYNDGVYSGYNYDYLTELAKYADWNYEFVNADFATCYEMLVNGEIDLVGSLFKSDERERELDFSDMEYAHAYTTLFTRHDSDIQSYAFEQFDGITIGVIDGAVNADYLATFAAHNGFSYITAEFGDVDELIDAVVSGVVDAGVLGGYTESVQTRMLAEFAPLSCYFATTKGNSEILVALNRAMNQLKLNDPYLENRLYVKHYKESAYRRLELTETERALAEASKTKPITVGIIPSSAPVCYWSNEHGAYEGIFMEILAEITKNTGLHFEYVGLDLSQNSPIGWLKQGYPELVAGVLKTQHFIDDRELVLSDELLDDSIVVVCRKEDDFTHDAENRVIAIPNGFQAAFEYAAEQLPKHGTKGYVSAEDCLSAVVSGEADAALYMRSSISYFLQNPHYESLEIVQAFAKDVDTCVAGLSADKTLLVNIIDKGLAMITENERNSIMMNYTIMNPYRLTFDDILYKYRVTVALISILIVLVIAICAGLIIVRRKSAKKLKAAYEQEKAALAIAEKASAAKGSFMSRMSHEIRTPLNAIIGYNTIARNELVAARDDADRKQADMTVMDCLTKSEMASKHLLTIINDVLDMSAIESGRIKVAHERFDFKGMISSLTALFYSQAKSKGVEFEVVFDNMTEEWFVGDQMRVNQILTNLLSNAVKFTSEGGRVKLTICQQDGKDQPSSNANAAHIHFEVADTGIGMSKEYLSHIWTPFEQADFSISRRFGGTGLGLSITKNLVDLMNGTIHVKSNEGVGSTFAVDITLGHTEQPKDSRTYDFNGINALIVDDDVSTCDYVRLLFTRCGARCKTFTSASKAVDAFSYALNTGDRFTVCLIDWHMPNMDGIETVKRIRSIADDDIPIIIISAYDFSEVADAAKTAGVNLFISKPLFQSSLFDLLANISGHQSPVKVSRSFEYNFSGARVLLAEDNAMNMEVAKKVLESANLTVEGVVNGREAVNKFETSPVGTYKVILMDVQMPEMDGHEATRTIRASAHPEARTIPVIAMTADAFAENVTEAIASGMNDHVAKPIDTQVLFETLSKYIPSVT